MVSKIKKRIDKLSCSVKALFIGIVSFWILFFIVFYPSYNTYTQFKKQADMRIENSKEYIKYVADNAQVFDENYDFSFVDRFEKSQKEIKKIFIYRIVDEKLTSIYNSKNEKDFNMPTDMLTDLAVRKIESTPNHKKRVPNTSLFYVAYTTQDADGNQGIVGYVIDLKEYHDGRMDIVWTLMLSLLVCAILSSLLGKLYLHACKKIENYEEKIYELSTTDSLTGASDRKHFISVGEKELKSSIRHGYNISLAIINVDQFHQMNKLYGIEYCNIVLKEIYNSIHDIIRVKDLVARYTGDEFIVLCLHTNKKQCQEVVERLQTRINSLLIEHENIKDPAKFPRITCGYGIAQYKPEIDMSITDLAERAEIALIESKKKGQNKITYV